MTFKEALTEAMAFLAQDERVLFRKSTRSSWAKNAIASVSASLKVT